MSNPPPSPTEIRGLRFGRNTVSGEMQRADLFDRGTSPHVITIGKSRSGKTYGVSQALAEGYLDGTIDNLFVADTQSGFRGLTHLCDGTHIVVDTQQAVNPFAIRALPRPIREATDAETLDPLETKVDEVVQFIVNTIRADAPDADIPMQMLRLAVELTYREAGITHEDLESHARPSPTPSDFVDTIARIHENAETYTFHEFEGEVESRIEQTERLLNSLLGYLEGGRYEHLLTGDDWGLLDDDVDMAYIDMAQKRDSSDAEKSAEIILALSQVGQKIKRAEGRTVFLIDEAHVLFHSGAMVDWLQKAAREWARFSSSLWFVSQSPQEFVQRREGVTAAEENKRRTIVEQCATIQVFNSPKATPDTLRQFGLNAHQIQAAKNELTPGWAGKGYSNCLIHFEDLNNWMELRVEASPRLHDVLTYSAREDGTFEEYMRIETAETGGEGGDPTEAHAPDSSRPEAVTDGGGD